MWRYQTLIECFPRIGSGEEIIFKYTCSQWGCKHIITGRIMRSWLTKKSGWRYNVSVSDTVPRVLLRPPMIVSGSEVLAVGFRFKVGDKIIYNPDEYFTYKSRWGAMYNGPTYPGTITEVHHVNRNLTEYTVMMDDTWNGDQMIRLTNRNYISRNG